MNLSHVADIENELKNNVDYAYNNVRGGDILLSQELSDMLNDFMADNSLDYENVSEQDYDHIIDEMEREYLRSIAKVRDSMMLSAYRILKEKGYIKE